jgi:hypothetical protein
MICRNRVFDNKTIISVRIRLSVLNNPTRYKSPFPYELKESWRILDYFIPCKMISENENTRFRILFMNRERKF